MSHYLQAKYRNNPLLVKSEVGKSKILGHKIPTGDFAFGKPSKLNQHGVKEMTSDWQYCEKSKPIQPQSDFALMNKVGLSQGATNSKNVKEFRSQNQIQLKVKQGTNEIKLKLPAEEFVFGKAAQKDTNMNKIMGINIYIYIYIFIKRVYLKVKKIINLKKRVQAIISNTIIIYNIYDFQSKTMLKKLMIK